MKTYRNLYPQVTDFVNLYVAFHKARKGKRHRPEVAEFAYNLEPNLFQLQEELETHTYQPGAYRNFYIRERKLRLISAAPFRDRVVHHALCNVLNPIWERRFIHDTYACRPGKGTHRAIDRCQHFAQRYPYVLQGDVHQFFPAIDHEITCRGRPSYDLVDQIACGPSPARANAPTRQYTSTPMANS